MNPDKLWRDYQSSKTICCTSVSTPPAAITGDLRYLKTSTSCNTWPLLDEIIVCTHSFQMTKILFNSIPFLSRCLRFFLKFQSAYYAMLITAVFNMIFVDNLQFNCVIERHICENNPFSAITWSIPSTQKKEREYQLVWVLSIFTYSTQ